MWYLTVADVVRINEGTALIAVTVLYGLNGWGLRADQGEAVDLAVDVAEGQADPARIAGTLEAWAYRLEVPGD